MNSGDISNAINSIVNPSTVNVALAIGAAFIGWKLCAKTMGFVSAFAQRASFLGLTAGVLIVSGLGSFGVGTGELVSRVSSTTSKPSKQGLTDENILKLVEKCHDRDMAEVVIEYARSRDGDRDEGERALATLVKNAQGKDGTGDKDHKALVSYIEYLKARENNKPHDIKIKKNDTNLVMNVSGPVGDNFDNETLNAAPNTKQDKDSLMPIPLSLGLMGLGVALAVCGGLCYKSKVRSETVKN
jgi:hypothetical protein